jgi:hypothetical protein
MKKYAVVCNTHAGRKQCTTSSCGDLLGKEYMESVGIHGKNSIRAKFRYMNFEDVNLIELMHVIIDGFGDNNDEIWIP